MALKDSAGCTKVEEGIIQGAAGWVLYFQITSAAVRKNEQVSYFSF